MLKLGQVVQGEVADIISVSAVLISFEGKLIRVQNQTQRDFEIGQVLKLKVVRVSPLAFQLYQAGRGRFSVEA